MAVLALYSQTGALHLALSTENAVVASVFEPGEGLDVQMLLWLKKHRAAEIPPRFLIYNRSASFDWARKLAEHLQIPAYLADPAGPARRCSLAPISGVPEIPRSCCGDTFIFKHLARLEAEAEGRPLEECRFIAAHLDRSIQIGALCGGKVIDFGTSADEGPFSFSEAGGLPFEDLLDLCGAAKDRRQLLQRMSLASGLKAYLELDDFSRLDFTNLSHSLPLQAFIYQIAKEIGAYAAVLEGRLQRILLSGDLLKHPQFAEALQKRIGFLGGLSIYRGNQGLAALLKLAENVP